MKAKTKPAQQQKKQPGIENKMMPQPKIEDKNYQGSAKLKNKVALITGGDSGIGKAIAISFAKEGADVAIVYLNEDRDAKETKVRIETLGRKCILLRGNIRNEKFCINCVKKTLTKLGKLNILVNNAAEQHPTTDLQDITAKQLENTFQTNIFAMFYLTKAAVKHLHQNDVIINTTSVTAYRGSKHLLDYSATKGAIVSFTRSLASMLVEKKIRVNGVAPGPIWTPLIPASFSKKEVSQFGSKTPMKRPGEPCEVAPSYVFLASADSSYMTGQILHPNGGEIVGG